MTAQDLFDEIQALIADELKSLDAATKANYLARRKAIIEAARSVYDSATIKAHIDPAVGNMVYVSKAEAMKYGRMAKLNDLVTEEAKLAGLTDISNLEKAGVKIYETGYDGYAWAYSQGYGLPITGGAKVKLVAEALYSDFYGASFDKTIKKNLKNWPDDIISMMTREMNQGHGFGQIAAKIADSTNKQYWQALRVAKTEGMRIGSQADLDSLALLDEVGAEYGKLWLHKMEGPSKSYTPRELHLDMDGREADKDGTFELPDGATGPAPRMTGDPKHDINCFPGFVYAEAKNIEKAYKRYYSGDIISIETAGGLKLTVTPNHPILTDKGWIAANLIDESCNVISMEFGQMDSVCKANINNSPSMLSEIFNFLSVWGTAKRTRGMDKQFHGDGCDGDIDIISKDSLLPNSDNPSIAKHGKKLRFSLPDINSAYLPILCTLGYFLVRALDSANRIMAILGNGLSIFCRSILVSILARLAITPNSKVKDFVVSRYNSTRTPKATGGSKTRLSSLIMPDKVISVSKDHFSGHVYNLQTKSNWYIVSDRCNIGKGIIAHNCTCTFVTIINGERPTERRIKGEGIVPYEQYRLREARWKDIPIREVRNARRGIK